MEGKQTIMVRFMHASACERTNLLAQLQVDLCSHTDPKSGAAEAFILVEVVKVSLLPPQRKRQRRTRANPRDPRESTPPLDTSKDLPLQAWKLPTIALLS